jgi:radical SAM protein with 4Fe4S-binding SPASM domain
VITPTNIGDLDNLREIVRELKPDIWKITSVMPIGKVEDNAGLHLNQEQFTHLMSFIDQTKKTMRVQVGENLGFLGRFEKKVRTDAFFCPVGFLACCIGVDGNVRGCPEQPDTVEFREGNILEKSFRDIWKEGFRKYREKKLLTQECSQCSLQEDCWGGCWVMKIGNVNCSVKRYNLQ